MFSLMTCLLASLALPTAHAAKVADYPIRESRRPLTLPRGIVEIEGAVPISIADNQVGLAFGMGASAGLSRTVDLGVATGFQITPEGGWNRTAVVQTHVLVKDGKKLDFAPGLVLPIDGGDFGFVVDLPFRVAFNKAIYLTFGQGAIPVVLGDNPAVSVVGNAGLGVQLGKSTVLLGEMEVFTVQLTPETASSAVWNNLGMQLGVQHSPSQRADVGVMVGLNDIVPAVGNLAGEVNVYGRVRF